MDILLRPQILQRNGLAISDFPKLDEAMAHADKLIEQNKVKFEHNVEPVLRDSKLLDEFFYVESRGKKREWTATESAKVTKDTDLKKGTDKENALVLVFGQEGEPGVGSTVVVKKESPQFDKVKTDAAAVSLFIICFFLMAARQATHGTTRVLELLSRVPELLGFIVTAWPNKSKLKELERSKRELQDCATMLKVKSTKDAKFADRADEAKKMCDQLSTFLDEARF